MYILFENMLKETPFLCLFLVEHQTISSFCTKGDPPFFLVAQPVMELTRRETGGSIRKALLLNMVKTGRVRQ